MRGSNLDQRVLATVVLHICCLFGEQQLETLDVSDVLHVQKYQQEHVQIVSYLSVSHKTWEINMGTGELRVIRYNEATGKSLQLGVNVSTLHSCWSQTRWLYSPG